MKIGDFNRHADVQGARMKEKKIYDRNWQKVREIRLKVEPLCRFCQKMGKITEATTVDHIIPVRKDPSLRLDLENTQSLCESCHDSIKQRMEAGDYNPIGEDGLPTSSEHPWNRGER